MNDLTHLQPGDIIAIPDNERSWIDPPKIRHRLYRVTKRTPTQAQAANIHCPEGPTIRVHIGNGRLVGESYTYAMQATPEVIAQHEQEVAARRRWSAVRSRLMDLQGKHLHQLKLNTEQMEVLAEAWERVKAMGQPAPCGSGAST